MKRFVALVLAAVLAIGVLAACGDNSTTPAGNGADSATNAAANGASDNNGSASADGTVVNVAVNVDPGTLSPWVQNNTGRINTLGSIYQHLVETDGLGGDMIPVIMESYEEVDPKTFDMKIREGIVDTAGNSIKASDVVFSYQTDIDMGFHAGRLGVIESVEATDEYTVRWTFTEEPADGGLCNVWIETYIVSQASYEASDDEMAMDPVGSTPYVLEEYVPGTSMTLKKADSYWQGEGEAMDLYGANVDTIVFKFVTELSQIATGLKTGELDMTNTIDSLDLADFQPGGSESDKFNAVAEMANPCYVLMFNCSDDSPMNNENLRKAVAYAIDADELTESLLGEGGYRLNAFANSKYGDYNDNWNKDGYFEYDLDTAMDYLAKFEEETGTKASDLNLVIVAKEGGMPMTADMTQAIQGYVMQLGINVTISTQPENNYSDTIDDSTKWDFGLLQDNSASTDFIISYLQNLILPDYYNHANGGGQQFIADDELIDVVREAFTMKGHTEANMDKINDIINDKMYFYGLSGFYEYFVTAKWITSVAHENRNCIAPGGCTYDWSLK